MNDISSGVKHRFYLTMMKLGLMSGMPVYYWDPIKGEEIFVYYPGDLDDQ